MVRAAQLTAQNRQRQLQAWHGRAGRGYWGCTMGEGSIRAGRSGRGEQFGDATPPGPPGFSPTSGIGGTQSRAFSFVLLDLTSNFLKLLVLSMVGAL